MHSRTYVFRGRLCFARSCFSVGPKMCVGLSRVRTRQATDPSELRSWSYWSCVILLLLGKPKLPAAIGLALFYRLCVNRCSVHPDNCSLSASSCVVRNSFTGSPAVGQFSGVKSWVFRLPCPSSVVRLAASGRNSSVWNGAVLPASMRCYG